MLCDLAIPGRRDKCTPQAGRSWAAAAAVSRVLAELPGWRWVGRLTSLSPLVWIETRGYYWFEAHRHRFGRWGVTPACARPGVACLPRGE
jgi:predicted DCC family thiol-disulfide oxidoreductase YuxK